MVNLEDFSQEAFNAKEWINVACTSRQGDEALDRFLAELEMQLQLNCEEVEMSLEDCTSQVLRRIPLVVQEVSRVQNELKGLQGDVVDLVGQLKEDRALAESAVSGIRAADKVKQNMEAACNTLQEATGLSDLFVRIDDIFARGDVAAMAEALSTMRRSLTLVGDVPEFSNGKEKVKVLEGSLVARITPRLADALASKQADKVKVLSDLLLSVDHYGTVEKLYASSRAAQVRVATEKLTSGLAAVSVTPEVSKSALMEWQESFIGAVEGEVQWCDSVLPEHSPKLIVRMIKTILENTNKVISASLSRIGALPVSICMQQTSLLFFQKMSRSLESFLDLDDMSSIALLLFAPYEAELQRYAVREKEQLMAVVQGLSLDSAGGEAEIGVDSIVSSICDSIMVVFDAAEVALQQCMEFTGGTELPSLLPVVDSVIGQYYTWLLTMLKAIRSKCLRQAKQDVSATDMASILQLLRGSCNLEKRIRLLHTILQDALVGLSPKLREAASDEKATLFDLSSRRLQRDAKALKTLRTMVSEAHSSTFMPIPGSEKVNDGFKAATNALVFDVLMAKLRDNFCGLADKPEWTKTSTSTGLSLPQFSAYALPYITSSGEYLMMLPQQLEALVGGEGEEDEQLELEEELAGLWLDKVVTGAAELYADEILQVKQLTTAGSAQLTADVQYFGNILSAMGFTASRDLSIIEKSLGMTIEELQKAAAAATNPTGEDFVWKTMAATRGAIYNQLSKPPGSS